MQRRLQLLLASVALFVGPVSLAVADGPPRPPYSQGVLSTLNYGMTSAHVAGNGGTMTLWAGYPRIFGTRIDFLSTPKIALGVDVSMTPELRGLVQAGPEAEFRLNFRWQILDATIFRAPFFLTLRIDPGYGLAGGRSGDLVAQQQNEMVTFREPSRLRHALIVDPTLLLTLQPFDPVAFTVGAGFAMSFFDDFPVAELSRDSDDIVPFTFRLRFTLGVDVALFDFLGVFGEGGFEIGIPGNAPPFNGFFRAGVALRIPDYPARDPLWEGLPDQPDPDAPAVAFAY